MEDKSYLQNRLIIVSNRLPIVLTKGRDNSWQVSSGSGGLVTAMAPVLKNRGGIWIGWAGNVAEEGLVTDQLLQEKSKEIGYSLKAINLTSEEKEMYYKGFANEVLWPLFHDFIAHCNFNPKYWKSYQQVNHKFAQTVTQNVAEDDFIWIHDYHLIEIVSELRSMGINNKIGFFLHIPFPPPDVFVRLPWRFQLLNSLLEYDLVGFQSLGDRRNFLQCIRSFKVDLKIRGKGQVISLAIEKREVRVGVFPIGIDFTDVRSLSSTQTVADKAWYIHENFANQKIVFGVDRLDYSKGIPDRLKAFRNALRRFPELREKISFVQIVVPSRREIIKYEALKTEIEQLVGEINGEFANTAWTPIHYFFRSFDQEDLIAYYRTAEIALITPLKDGMNLVAKEYCASNLEETGVLILSEFAGAAGQLKKGAIIVNPHDTEGMAEAIYKAFHMAEESKKTNMRILRQNVRRYDIFWWVNSFLQAAISRKLESFPLIEEYLPLTEDEKNNI